MALLGLAGARADTPVSGSVSGQWDAAHSPYVVTGAATVPAGQTLDVDAGVVVRFQDKTGLVVNGILNVNGSAAAPVTFTSDGNGTAGAWYGVAIQNGGVGTLHSLAVRYAGEAGGYSVPGQPAPHAAGLFVYRASLTLTGGTVDANGGDGVYYYNDDASGGAPVVHTLSVTGTALTNNSGAGINVEAANASVPSGSTVLQDAFTFSGNTVSGNAGAALQLTACALTGVRANTFSGNTGGDGLALTGGTLYGTASLPAGLLAFVYQSVSVAPTGALTLAAGDVFRFQDRTGLFVDGSLTAAGTMDAPINFTTNGNNLAPGAWAGIGFRPGATGTLDHIVERFAGLSGGFSLPGQISRTTGLFAYRASLTLTNSVVDQVGGDAVYYYNDGNAGRSLSVSSTFFTNAENDGLSIAAIHPADVFQVSGNTFTGNGGFPIRMLAAALNRLGAGNTASGNVLGNGIGVTGGSLIEDVSLPPSLAYCILSTVSIPAANTMTVAEGDALDFRSNVRLQVNGHLFVNGTPAAPAAFTADTAFAATTIWAGIGFAEGATGALSNAVLSGAGYTSAFQVGNTSAFRSAALFVYRANLSLSNVAISGTGNAPPAAGNTDAAVYYYNDTAAAHSLAINGGSVTASANDGISVAAENANDAITISGVTVAGSGRYPILIPPRRLTALSNNTVSANATPMTVITGGALDRDAALNANAAYLALGVVTVAAGKALTAQSGSVTAFATGAYLDVVGTLNANGTSDAPATFTSSAAVPAPGGWGGLLFESGSTGTLNNAVVRCAGQVNTTFISGVGYAQAGVTVARANVAATNLMCSQNAGDGLVYYNSSVKPHTLSVQGGAFTGNTGDGLHVRQAPAADSVTVSTAALSGNGAYGLELVGTAATTSLPALTSNGNGKYPFRLPANALPGLSTPAFSGNTMGDFVDVTGGTFGVNATAQNPVTAGVAYPVVVEAAGFTVAPNATLNLGVGASFRMGQNAALLVSGTLNAAGAPERPVLFTADAASPVPGYWAGVGFAPESSGALDYVETRYGGAAMSLNGSDSTTASVAAQDAALALNHSLLRDGAGTLLVLTGALNFTASNTTLADTTAAHAQLASLSFSGRAVFGGSAAAGCDFLSVQPSAFVNTGYAAVMASSDFWDAPDGPNPPGHGAGVTGAVDTSYFLAAPANLPVAALTAAHLPRGAATVSGTATSPYFALATLTLGGGGSTRSATFAAPVTGGPLATLDTSNLPDGPYTLTLAVTDRLNRTTITTQNVTIGSGAPGSGDLNGNGTVEVADAVAALRIAAGLRAAQPGDVSAGDVRPVPGANAAPFGDGRLTLEDALAILRQAVSPAQTFP